MKLVVGLGNPGARYADTRHNAGALVVLALAQRWGVSLEPSRWLGDFGRARYGGHDVGLLLPTPFMNRSGESVRAALEGLGDVAPGEDLLIAYDDLDLPLGTLRLRAGGGSGGHNGMESIALELGLRDFPRLRFGIGRPPGSTDVVNYVLSPFDPGERSTLARSIERAADAVEEFMREGIDAAMTRFNRADPLADAQAELLAESTEEPSE